MKKSQLKKIIRESIRKSAKDLIKEDGTHGSNMQHSNCTTPSRAPNTFPGNPGGAQCAGRIRAIRCSEMPDGWDILVDGDPCNQPGVSCHTDTFKIKVFPPNVTMSSPYNNPPDDSCHGGYTPVVGDYILSPDGSNGYVGWQVVNVSNYQDKCDGPRRNHPACVSALNMGCTDPNANNFNVVATQDCNGDAPGTNNPGWDSCCTYPNIIPGCTDPTALNYDPNATQDDGSCLFSTFDCISGLCEENIAGTGVYANLDVCLTSEECDRYECLTTQDPGALEEQDVLDPTISNCVKCDTNRYDVVNDMWDPLCQYLNKQDCDVECTPVEPPEDPCEDFVLGIFQGGNPCCELCGETGYNSGVWNTSTYIGPSTHPNLPQCWYTCQCCTMPVQPVEKDIECQQCGNDGAPIANMFPGPLCPAGWTPAQQFNPSSCKKPAKMIEPTKDLDIPLNEGLRLKGKLLNKLRMTKLANIKK